MPRYPKATTYPPLLKANDAESEPCEECGTFPADDLVGTRWLCADCGADARGAEGEAEA